MTGKRNYDDGCATAHALDLVGERWALLVVRELMLGPKRFSDLRSDLRTISPNVLTQRLAELEAAAIVQRRKLPPPAASWVYELTPWGKDLEPIIRALGFWAARSPQMPQGRPMSTAALVLAMRTMFDPDRAGTTRMRMLLHLGHSTYRVTVARGSLEIEPGDPRQASDGGRETFDVEVRTDSETFDALLFGDLEFDTAKTQGTISVTGDETVLGEYRGFFPLPEPAPRAAV
jgi:DNA-binding HxlR family transcriptional regulator